VSRTATERRRGRAIIVGGGIGGLAAAILLARRFRRVTVLERDVRPPAASPDEAFALWQRPGVPQFRHSHTFLARLSSVLRERFPEVLDELRRSGTLELPLIRRLPPPAPDLGPRQRGDGELVLLGCRRAAFEWALWRVAQRTQGLELREGVFVAGLTAARKRRNGGPPLVTGVKLRKLAIDEPAAPPGRIPWYPKLGRSSDDGTPRATFIGDEEVLPGALVIDASGRRSRAPEWLAEIGARRPHERRVDTGIFYFTRFYRLTGASPPGATTGLVAGDVGWLKCATFPGDGDTFSITLGTDIDDRPLRALAQPRVFEALIAAFPQLAAFRARGVSEPIDGPDTPVLVMGGLKNSARSFVRDGRPLARGFVAIGDAAYHSNPIYGRGATCALLTASALDDAVAAHQSDTDAAILAFAAQVQREVEPFWESAAAGDRLRAQAAENGNADGFVPLRLLANPRRLLATVAGRVIAFYVDRGILPASRRDGQVFRAVMRVMNMLDEPLPGLFAPDVVARVLPVIAGSLFGRAEATRFAGPSRGEALQIVAAATSSDAAKRRAKRKTSQSRARSRASVAPLSRAAAGSTDPAP
jgi:2-polyprenyl-6-methoxyphenol hydroxylase-like FAD-dependent oxidoreductase